MAVPKPGNVQVLGGDFIDGVNEKASSVCTNDQNTKMLYVDKDGKQGEGNKGSELKAKTATWSAGQAGSVVTLDGAKEGDGDSDYSNPNPSTGDSSDSGSSDNDTQSNGGGSEVSQTSESATVPSPHTSKDSTGSEGGSQTDLTSDDSTDTGSSSTGSDASGNEIASSEGQAGGHHSGKCSSS